MVYAVASPGQLSWSLGKLHASALTCLVTQASFLHDNLVTGLLQIHCRRPTIRTDYTPAESPELRC